jgi:DNA processing protein
MRSEHEALLWLSAAPLIGAGKLRALVGRFRSAEKVLSASKKELMSVDGIDVKTAESIKSFDGARFVKDQSERLIRADARLISFWEEDYPDALKQIYDPPAFLFVKGELKKQDAFSIAIVGTRQPSNYGKLTTERFTRELAQAGFAIVSGLAYGVDTLAHKIAVEAGGRTIAVLGSGGDVIYPNENRGLAKKIASSGALVSEFPLGTDPDRNNFPRRNRIICGLSLGTLVIEAGAKSGALITAAMALDQGREVFAVPGNIDSPKSIGANELIKQGAKLAASVQDILEEIQPQFKLNLQFEKKPQEELNLSEPEKIIFNLISHEPMHIDAIAAASGTPTSLTLSRLLSLELKNLVRQLPGKYFVRF